jgi:hypothetical protein
LGAGHTIPSIETLEKWARALEVPLYQLFYSGEERPEPPKSAKIGNSRLWGSKGKEARILTQLRRTLKHSKEADRQLLLHMARRLAKTKLAWFQAGIPRRQMNVNKKAKVFAMAQTSVFYVTNLRSKEMTTCLR